MQPSLQPFGSIATFSLKMKTVGPRQPNQRRPQHSHVPLPGTMVPSPCSSSLPALSIRHTVHRDTVSDCTTECGQQKKASKQTTTKIKRKMNVVCSGGVRPELIMGLHCTLLWTRNTRVLCSRTCSPHNVCEQHLSHLSWAVLPTAQDSALNWSTLVQLRETEDF